MRVILCDDSSLFREGLALLLADAGITVVGQAADAHQLLRLIQDDEPDVVVVDIRLPPTFSDEGIRAAEAIRSRWPRVAVLALSTYAETAYAAQLLATSEQAVGYLLKDRVADTPTLLDALRRLTSGEVVVDPTVVARLVTSGRQQRRLDPLSDRERDVLALMAQGRSNSGIGSELFLSAKTVETHVASVFSKLGLTPQPSANRRVLAVLAWLRVAGTD